MPDVHNIGVMLCYALQHCTMLCEAALLSCDGLLSLQPHGWNALQAGARGMLARADARRERRLQAAVTIQKNMRMLKARSRFVSTKTATLVIQSAWRGRVARSVAMDIRFVKQSSCPCQ